MLTMAEDIATAKKVGSIEFFIEERSEERVRGRMPVAPGMLNPFGVINAGAMIWFADITASILAIGNREVTPDGKGFALAVNIQTNLIANQRDGEIYAEATFLKNGRRLVVVKTRITGTDGRLLAEVTSTHVPVV